MAKASKMGWGAKGGNGIKVCLDCKDQIKPVQVMSPKKHMEYESKCGRKYKNGQKVEG